MSGVFYFIMGRIMTVFNSAHPGWLEIFVDADPFCHESLCAFFFDLGCTGIVSEGHTLKTYLPFQENLEEVRNQIQVFFHNLEEIFPEIHSPELTFNKIQNEDWGRNWRRFFRPDRVAPGLTVFPFWEPVPSSLTGHVILVDPGPAFGTGKHPTTRMCLEALERIELPGSWTMLDVGTGTGILAMYGVKLKAGRVLGIDIDEEALRWARRNIELNGLSGAIELSSKPLGQLKDSFSVLAANLILAEILKLLPDFPCLLNPGGWLILSGILRDQVKEVRVALDGYSVYEHETLYQEEWACMICRKDVKQVHRDKGTEAQRKT